MKLGTDNRQQRKQKQKNDNDASPNRNKDLKSTVQNSAMSKEEVKGVCNLLSEDSLTVERMAPVLMRTLQFIITPAHHKIQKNPAKKWRTSFIFN